MADAHWLAVIECYSVIILIQSSIVLKRYWSRSQMALNNIKCKCTIIWQYVKVELQSFWIFIFDYYLRRSRDVIEQSVYLWFTFNSIQLLLSCLPQYLEAEVSLCWVLYNSVWVMKLVFKTWCYYEIPLDVTPARSSYNPLH